MKLSNSIGSCQYEESLLPATDTIGTKDGYALHLSIVGSQKRGDFLVDIYRDLTALSSCLREERLDFGI